MMSCLTVRVGRAGMGILVLTATALVAACGSSEAPRVDVQLGMDMPDSVPLGEPLHITYSWAPGADFAAPADDYQVFVHALDPQGNIVFQDDHYPPEPTSQWSSGEPISYDRWVYVPAGLEVDRLDFEAGLYSPEGRVLLRGDADTWSDAIDTHTVEIRVDDMSGVPAYIEGWHNAETTDDGELTWRWTEGLARVAFTNPRRDATLHLRAHGPFDEVGAQTVVLRVGETEVGRIEIGNAAVFIERLEIPAAAMGDDDWVELSLETTPVLVPKELDANSSDERTLGLQVFLLYLSSAS